jgi:DNA-binding NarL/FixJ family response regulator
MRVLILDVEPWRNSEVKRCLQRVEGFTPLLEDDLSASDAESPALTVLVSETAVRDDGKRSIANIRISFPHARVLILGANEDKVVIADLVAAGADGYFLMSKGAEKLASAINVVARGAYWLPESAVAFVTRRLRTPNKPEESLNDADQSLLSMVTEGLTNGEIAGRLGVKEMTVKRQLSRLYRRFRVRTRAQLIKYAARNGIIPPES